MFNLAVCAILLSADDPPYQADEPIFNAPLCSLITLLIAVCVNSCTGGREAHTKEEVPSSIPNSLVVSASSGLVRGQNRSLRIQSGSVIEFPIQNQSGFIAQ